MKSPMPDDSVNPTGRDKPGKTGVSVEANIM